MPCCIFLIIIDANATSQMRGPAPATQHADQLKAGTEDFC